MIRILPWIISAVVGASLLAAHVPSQGMPASSGNANQQDAGLVHEYLGSGDGQAQADVSGYGMGNAVAQAEGFIMIVR
jgi:hypothetical protein